MEPGATFFGFFPVFLDGTPILESGRNKEASQFQVVAVLGKLDGVGMGPVSRDQSRRIAVGAKPLHDVPTISDPALLDFHPDQGLDFFIQGPLR